MGKSEMMRDMRIIISLVYGTILDIGSEISVPACAYVGTVEVHAYKWTERSSGC